MLRTEIFHLATGNQLAHGSHGRAGIDLSRTELRGPRRKPTCVRPPTACAGLPAQSLPCGVDVRALGPDSLATRHSPLAAAFLTATVPNSKIQLSPWEPTLSQFLIATKNRSVRGGPPWRTAFPSLQRSQFLDGLGRDPLGEIPFLPQGRQTLFVSQCKGNYLAGFAIVSLGASGVPEVYNPGRFLRRFP
jgi:hypothetical protein